MDFSISCLVVALAEFVGVLESAFVGEALDKHIDGLTKFAECFQGDSSHRGDSPERSEDRRASRGAKCLIFNTRPGFPGSAMDIFLSIWLSNPRVHMGPKEVCSF